MNQPRTAPVSPQTSIEKIRDAIQFRIDLLRQSERVLTQHQMNVESYGYEPRIDELESLLVYLEKEVSA